MFELWPFSVLMLIVAFIIYIILKDADKTGSIFVGIVFPRISKKRHPEYFQFWYYFRVFGLVICVICAIVFLLIDVSNAPKPEPEPEFTNAEFEEILIGNWTGKSMFFDEKINLTIHSNYTCRAIYNGKIYNGSWQDDTDKYVNSIRFSWDEKLQVPSPFADFEGFDQYVTITDADCHHSGRIMSNGGVIFTKNY